MKHHGKFGRKCVLGSISEELTASIILENFDDGDCVFV
jgi:hypothetical protein